MTIFYSRYCELCAKVNKSVSGVASAIGLSNAAANGWKKGKMPSDTTLSKLSNYFGVSIEWLTGEATTTDGVMFSDGTGYGGGFAPGAGFGDGSGYGGSAEELTKDVQNKKSPAPEGAELKISDDDMKHLKQFHRADPATKEAIRLLLLKFSEEEHQ